MILFDRRHKKPQWGPLSPPVCGQLRLTALALTLVRERCLLRLLQDCALLAKGVIQK